MSLESAEGAFIDPDQTDAAARQEGGSSVQPDLEPRDFPDFGAYWRAVHAAGQAATTVDFSHVKEAQKGPRRISSIFDDFVEVDTGDYGGEITGA